MLRVIFKEEFKDATLNKSIISFFILIFLAYSLIPNYSNLNLKVIIPGIVLTSGLYSLMYSLSKLKDKKLNLWRVLPIDNKIYDNTIILIIWIKIFVLKLLPFIIGIMLKIKGCNKYMIINLIFVAFLSYLVSLLMFYLAILIQDKGFKLKKKNNEKRNIVFTKSGLLLMKREWIRLFENKIIWINHFAYMAFILFFINNGLNNGLKELAPYLLILTFLSSTASISYSSDRDALEFYEIMPIDKYKVYNIKLIFNILISLPLTIGSFIILKPYFSDTGSLLYFIIYGLIITTALKLYIDFKQPILNWNHVKQIFEDKRRYKLSVIIIIAMLPIAITIVKDLIVSILWSIFIIICIIFIWYKDNFKRTKL